MTGINGKVLYQLYFAECRARDVSVDRWDVLSTETQLIWNSLAVRLELPE